MRLALRSAELLRAETDRIFREKNRFRNLELAAAGGNFDEWVSAMDEFIMSLPEAEDLSNAALVSALDKLHKGRALTLPVDVEMRLLELVEVLNKAMDRNDATC